jgi:hypothetical protein
VPIRKSPRRPPVEYLASGAWPNGQIHAKAPAETHLAQAMAGRLRIAIGERSVRQVAIEAELSPQTVANLVQGISWGDMVTIARLERVLGVTLWGDEHRGG